MPEIIRRLGDAIAGVDRTGAFIEGQQAAADYDYTRSQTDRAMQDAESARLDAERQQQINRAAERLQQMDPTSMMQQGFGDLVVGEFGSSAAGAYQGRLRDQEFGMRSDIADPTMPQETRQAAAQALSPGDLADPYPGNLSLEIIQTDDGPRFVLPVDALGQAPGSRPSSSSAGDGFYPSADMNAIRAIVADRLDGIFDPDTGAISGLDPTQADRAREIMSAAAQLLGNNPGLDHATAVSQALQQIQGGGEEYSEGDIVENPNTGERLELRRNAQGDLEWLPAD